MNDESHLQFEKAIERLEQIVDKMNEGRVSLENSIQLYEEANSLIAFCQSKLSHAEEKIEYLIKNRDNKVLLSEDNKPLTKTFEVTHASTY